MTETNLTTNLTVDVVDAQGKKSGSAELPAEVFGVQVNVPLIHQVVVAQLAAARQGTHQTKGRGEVRGGGAKPWRQKGTGRARQGSRRAPQWVGGGVVHGPQSRSYAQRTPKKMVAAALRGALSDRAREGRIHVVASLAQGDTPSTKAAVAALTAVAENRKVVVVLHRDEDLAWLSLRNVGHVHALAVDQLNAYDVLRGDDVVFTQAAFDAFLAGPATGRSSKAVARESDVTEAASVAGEPFRGAEPPAGFDIKGNEDSMKFHTPESPWYGRTVAEVWFDSVAAAEAAGFVNAVTAENTDDAAEEADQ